MGGTNNILEAKDKYSSLFIKSIRKSALLLPFIVVTYGLLAHQNVFLRSHIYSTEITIIVITLLLSVAVVQYFTDEHSIKTIFLYVTIYHILAGLFLIYVSGFMNPPSVLWIPLLVVSDLYYGKKGLIYSGAVLLAITFLSLASMPSIDLPTTINHFVYAITIVSLGLFVSSLKNVYTAEHTDLIRTKKIQGRAQGQIDTLINSLNESIIGLNTLGIVQTYNAATLNLLDTNQSLAGKHVNDILHLYDQTGKPVKFFELLKDSSVSNQWDEFEHRFADGEEVRFGITTSVVRNNSPQAKNHVEGYIVLIRDITKSKSLEEERDEFISVVSHELRTPITITEGALSNVQLLMERGADRAKLTSTVKSAHDQVLYLAKMVNDLSTLSRAERGVADTPEIIDVTAMLHDLYSQYVPKADEKGLVLDLDAHGKLGNVKASRLYLEEILQNFITNAIKYTLKGTVTISANLSKDIVTFSVKDSGIGISKPDQKKVFEKFYRSEDYRTRETSGTGLGLYVVRKLAHKLDTSVKLSSRLNYGSTFSFTLPASSEKIDESDK